MSLIENIINYLIAKECAVAKDTDIFQDFVPDNPDDIIAILEYTGSAPAMFTSTSNRSLQVVVRAKTFTAARDKSWKIFNTLYREDLHFNETNLQGLIFMRQTPFKLLVDSASRTTFVFNFSLTISF